MRHPQTLFIVGTPLAEHSKLDATTCAVLEKCQIIFAETPKRTLSLFSRSGLRLPLEKLCFLDRTNVLTHAQSALLNLSGERDAAAALLSDCGMPILFDPGLEILESARKSGFIIRVIPAPTSWGTAMAVSGYSPPFCVLGFFPQKREKRHRAIRQLLPLSQHTVILETPYRFSSLLQNLKSVLGQEQQAFLAWEIAGEKEFYEWGTLSSIEQRVKRSPSQKGEFILILKARAARINHFDEISEY